VLVGHDRVRTLLRKFFHRRLGANTRRCVWCRKLKAPKTFLLPACRFSRNTRGNNNLSLKPLLALRFVSPARSMEGDGHLIVSFRKEIY